MHALRLRAPRDLHPQKGDESIPQSLDLRVLSCLIALILCINQLRCYDTNVASSIVAALVE